MSASKNGEYLTIVIGQMDRLERWVMTMIIPLKITIDPNQIAENVPDAEIHNFIIELNENLDSDVFTIELILGLLVFLRFEEDEIEKMRVILNGDIS